MNNLHANPCLGLCSQGVTKMKIVTPPTKSYWLYHPPTPTAQQRKLLIYTKTERPTSWEISNWQQAFCILSTRRSRVPWKEQNLFAVNECGDLHYILEAIVRPKAKSFLPLLAETLLHGAERHRKGDENWTLHLDDEKRIQRETIYLVTNSFGKIISMEVESPVSSPNTWIQEAMTEGPPACLPIMGIMQGIPQSCSVPNKPVAERNLPHNSCLHPWANVSSHNKPL